MRKKRTLKTPWSASKHRADRIGSLILAGLTFKLQQIINPKDRLVLRIGIPQVGTEYWICDSAPSAVKLSRMPNSLYELMENAKLIIDDDLKPIHKEKLIKQVGLKIQRYFVRW